MTQNYGVSFAQKLIDLGQYDEAIAAASQAILRDPQDPEPLVDRAAALSASERFGEAVRDLEEALRLDDEAQVLETDFVDDALFAALLGEARALVARDAQAAVARLQHYRARFPAGRHLQDVERWSRQLRGERDEAPIVKEREA